MLLSLALSGCNAPPAGMYSPIAVPEAPSDEPPLPAARAFEHIGLRFDASRRCPLSVEGRNALYEPSGPLAGPTGSAPLSPGDLIEVRVTNGDRFSGTHVIDADGLISIPYLPPITAIGRSPADLERDITAALIDGELFRRDTALVAVRLRQLGEISVRVSGSVFSPGLVSANERTEGRRDEIYDTAFGAETWSRRLSGVLKAAGGIRPDADLSNIILRRNGRDFAMNMQGVLDGRPVVDPMLTTGDEVVVPTSGCFNDALARPGRITPPGVRVFISNATAPVFSNASSAIGTFSSRTPYGSRLLQALASGNCIGGARLGSGQRYALLVGENALSGGREAMRVDIEALMREPHRNDLNPVLQPGDAVACYDAEVINARELGSAASSVLTPVQILKTLLGL